MATPTGRPLLPPKFMDCCCSRPWPQLRVQAEGLIMLSASPLYQLGQLAEPRVSFPVELTHAVLPAQEVVDTASAV